jgi:hypothetical protein
LHVGFVHALLKVVCGGPAPITAVALPLILPAGRYHTVQSVSAVLALFRARHVLAVGDVQQRVL